MSLVRRSKRRAPPQDFNKDKISFDDGAHPTGSPKDNSNSSGRLGKKRRENMKPSKSVSTPSDAVLPKVSHNFENAMISPVKQNPKLSGERQSGQHETPDSLKTSLRSKTSTGSARRLRRYGKLKPSEFRGVPPVTSTPSGEKENFGNVSSISILSPVSSDKVHMLSPATSVRFELSDIDDSNYGEAKTASTNKRSAAVKNKSGTTAKDAQWHLQQLKAEFCDIDDFLLVEEEIVVGQDTSRLR